MFPDQASEACTLLIKRAFERYQQVKSAHHPGAVKKRRFNRKRRINARKEVTDHVVLPFFVYLRCI